MILGESYLFNTEENIWIYRTLISYFAEHKPVKGLKSIQIHTLQRWILDFKFTFLGQQKEYQGEKKTFIYLA